MRPPLHSTLAILFASLVSLPLFAQQQAGRIHGTVTDVTHEILPGASVTLTPGNLRTATGREGDFQFLNVAPGTYKLTIHYVGFTTATETIHVANGQTLEVTPVLNVTNSEQRVVVTAPRPYGVSESINTERTATNLVDVLPETVITSLPNANVADVVGRMPGVTLERDEGEGKYVQIRGLEPRLSNTTVDGVDIPAPESGIRQVKLDVLPADLVGSVELNKTLRPNMNGDAIGGSVDLVTKTAGNVPQVTLYTLGGITPIDNTRHAGEVGGTVGGRFGKHKGWGAILSGSYDYNGRGIDDVEPVPDALAGSPSVPYFDNADFRQYLYQRNRYGLGGSLDRTLGPNSSLYLRGILANFTDGGHRTLYNLDATGNGPSATSEQRIGNYLVSTLILGGMETMPSSDMWVNWQVSAARSRMLNPQFDNYASFGYTGPASQCGYNDSSSNPYTPAFTPACFQEAENSNDFALSKLKLGGYGQFAAVNLAERIDASKGFNTANTLNTIAFGAQYTNSHDFDDSYKLVYNPAQDANGNPILIPLGQFTDSSYVNKSYYNGNYPELMPWVNYGAVQSYVLTHASQFVESSTRGQDSNNYNLTEKIPAVYFMDTTDIGPVRLMGGLRMEHTSVNTLGPDNSGALTVHGQTSYTDLLPTASFQYHLTTNSDLRLVYGRGLSRPIPQDLVPYVSIDASGNPVTVSLGNPALVPEHANNYDFEYEYFLTPLGALRGGYFYKSFTDPIVTLQSSPTTGAYAGDRVFQTANAGTAYDEGVEVGFEQQFTYLPGIWRGLGLSGNYSYTTSRAYNVNPTGPRSENPPMLRQAPNTWNLSPTYDYGRVSGRVGLAYNGPNIYQYNFVDGVPGGLAGPSGDVYEYTHFQVDAQFSYWLNHRLQLTVQGLNLNNAVFGFYQGSSQFPIQREFYHPTYSLGLRWTLDRE